jgi:CHAT domain-containing protein
MVDVSLEQLETFTNGVKSCVERGESLDATTLAMAKQLWTGILRDEVRDAMIRLTTIAKPVLIRLFLEHTKLHAVAWEALCDPKGGESHIGTAPNFLFARGVRSDDGWDPRKVKGAVTVLGISPRGSKYLQPLLAALDPAIKVGEIEWMAPVVDDAARRVPLFERLTTAVQVIHFVGHGGVDDRGHPLLELAKDGTETIRVEDLADRLASGFRGQLRLVVLEACEGAQPGELASAAEILCRKGADAVVAYLWPVRADAARASLGELYRSLSRATETVGDVAMASRSARQMVDGAERASLVLYLRAPESVLFTFPGNRVLVPPTVPASVKAPAGHPAVERIISQDFSLLLGDRFRAQRANITRFRATLEDRLKTEAKVPVPQGPLSAVTQRFSFYFGETELDKVFQDFFENVEAELPFLLPLAKRLRPGVHISLQRLPILETAIARAGIAPVFVLQPPASRDDPPSGYFQEPGSAKWQSRLPSSSSIDLTRSIVVLRLFGGYQAEDRFLPPLLTENDYLFAGDRIDSLVGPELAPMVLRSLKSRPLLLAGVSKLVWHHRMLLHRLFGPTPLPDGTVVVSDPEEPERKLWTPQSRSDHFALELATMTAQELATQLEGGA